MEENKYLGQFSRRAFLKLGASGFAAVILARCAPAAAPEATTAPAATEPPKAPVTIEFLAWGDAVDIPAWEKLSKLYMERNPHVTVTVTTVADPNANFYPKLQTSIAGGTPPQLSSFQGWEWQTYADKQLLAAVDDLVARDGFTAAYPTEFQSVLDTTKRSGKTYLVPLQFATMVMFYAKKPFDDAGIPYPTDDWTWNSSWIRLPN
jgi:multiple sugar transport system substrate-binding protein